MQLDRLAETFYISKEFAANPLAPVGLCDRDSGDVMASAGVVVLPDYNADDAAVLDGDGTSCTRHNNSVELGLLEDRIDYAHLALRFRRRADIDWDGRAGGHPQSGFK